MRTRFSIVVTAIIVTLVLLEAGLRFYLTNWGDERRKTLYLYSREELNREQLLYHGLAFMNYGLNSAHSEVNSLGYRGPEIVMPKPESTYRIVALGGSTTYGAFLDSWEEAFPHQLQLLLQEDSEIQDIDVINGGVPGYSSWESAVNVLLRIPDIDPDMLIVYHAFNDLLVRTSDPSFFDGLNTGNGYWIEYDDPLPASALFRFVLTRLGHKFKTTYSLADVLRTPDNYRACGNQIVDDDLFCDKLDMNVSDVLAANPSIYFERNLRNIVRLAQAMDIEALLLTWAYSPLDYPSFDGGAMSFDVRQAGIQEHNAIVRQVAEEETTLFYDLAARMPIEKRYWVNGVHMSAAGTRRMAQLLAAYIESAHPLDTLSQSS